MEKKITLVGGGSFQWTPKLLIDFVLNDELEGCQLFLHDVHQEALNLMQNLGERVIEEGKKNYYLRSTLSLEEALEGADYVILSISTGGLDTAE